MDEQIFVLKNRTNLVDGDHPRSKFHSCIHELEGQEGGYQENQNVS